MSEKMRKKRGECGRRGLSGTVCAGLSLKVHHDVQGVWASVSLYSLSTRWLSVSNDVTFP